MIRRCFYFVCFLFAHKHNNRIDRIEMADDAPFDNHVPEHVSVDKFRRFLHLYQNVSQQSINQSKVHPYSSLCEYSLLTIYVYKGNQKRRRMQATCASVRGRQGRSRRTADSSRLCQLHHRARAAFGRSDAHRTRLSKHGSSVRALFHQLEPQHVHITHLTISCSFIFFIILSFSFVCCVLRRYLVADQIGLSSSSSSKPEGYIAAIMKGARLVEADVYDGSDGTPKIYHHNTLTSKIAFEDALVAIREYAFKLTE